MAKATGKAARINPLLTAIIFIEYQNDYTTEGGALYDTVKQCMEATGTLQNSKELMEAAREAGVTVIHMPMVYDKVRLIVFISTGFATSKICTGEDKDKS